MDQPSDIQVTLPDGSKRAYAPGTTISQVAHSIGRRLGRDAVGGMLGDSGQVVDVHMPLHRDTALRIVTVNSQEGLEVLRHSTAHLLASAVQTLFPGTQVTIGPAIASGFFYDFERAGGFSSEDLEALEAEMHRQAQHDEPFVRSEIERGAAIDKFRGMGEHYKVELIEAIPPDQTISLYHCGDWVDLCRGPHVPSTGYIKHFKLTHTSGAYWRGDERNPMLARIYGTAFWQQKDLDKHFAQLEEAKKRDHRRLGVDLDLFSFHPLAPAMPFFHPDGAAIYRRLTELVQVYYEVLGFQEVVTPQIYDMQLFHQSGHYEHYRQN
ncbi:MAG: TGS domain-containing protein, partial [Deltaproteobacteria bacterium]